MSSKTNPSTPKQGADPAAKGVPGVNGEAPFIPSTEWQDVPDWAVLPNGGEYRMNLQDGRNQVRWHEPVPIPETVIDRRTLKTPSPADEPEEKERKKKRAGVEKAFEILSESVSNFRQHKPVVDPVHAGKEPSQSDCDEAERQAQSATPNQAQSAISPIPEVIPKIGFLDTGAQDDLQQTAWVLEEVIKAYEKRGLTDKVKQLRRASKAIFEQYKAELHKRLQTGSGSQQTQGQQHQTPRKLSGASIWTYSKRQIDWSQNLIGSRWLSRQQGAFIVAPSGHGKSTLGIQASICWSCGRPAFALPADHPLRMLILQSEDDDNDIIEMSWMVDRLALTEREAKLVDQNTHVEWLNDVTGKKFFEAAEDYCSQFKPDVLVINPFSAYTGADITDDKANNDFLRNYLSALLKRHNCAALPIHHTPKTQYQNTKNFSWFDWMYAMAGGAALTNWARGVKIVVPTELPGTYKFIAAKRFEKSGWKSREYWFSHSVENEKFLWVPSTQDQIAGAQTGRLATPDALFGIIPPIDPILEAELILLAKDKLHVGRDAVRDLLKILLHRGTVFTHRISRPGVKGGTGYSKIPPSVSP
jgi:hypothetical protein